MVREIVCVLWLYSSLFLLILNFISLLPLCNYWFTAFQTQIHPFCVFCESGSEPFKYLHLPAGNGALSVDGTGETLQGENVLLHIPSAAWQACPAHVADPRAGLLQPPASSVPISSRTQGAANNTFIEQSPLWEVPQQISSSETPPVESLLWHHRGQNFTRLD